MSNAQGTPADVQREEDAAAEEEPSWFDRLRSTFGLGEEPELRELIENALARGKGAKDSLSAQERVMLLNILRFGALRVEDVMVPRADIVAVEESASLEDLMRIFHEAEHSRLPVYRQTLDDPRGMIHIRDLMSLITMEAEAKGVASAEAESADAADKPLPLSLTQVHLSRKIGSVELVRPMLYVPASMGVLDLLLKMQTTRIHLALVVDEYGGTEGLVSIEDLVEEVVGEIDDEHDVEDEPPMREDARLGLLADARTPIEDLEKHLGLELVSPEQKEDIDTLGGLVFSLAGRVPARGELVPHPIGIEFEVLEADPRRIQKLRIHRKERVLPDPAADASRSDAP